MRYFLYCRKSHEEKERQVLSLSSQLDVARNKFEGDPTVTIVEVLEESKSAKLPGRPIFNQMLARIERGEADGVVAYTPDRLARNSVDAGWIVYLLDLGVLKDIKFVTYTFENNPAGKLMLQIMLAQSKHFSDALSERVRIGIDKKVELGWRPNRAPEGYLNERDLRTIVVDPARFPLIRAIFDLFLTGHSPAEITRRARNDWGYLTRRAIKSGGKPLALSTVYKILGNPFYAGMIRWRGQLFPGNHTPVVTIEEFNAVQARLKRTNARRPQTRSFALTGLIRCGGCGLMVTAEEKTKPSGRTYAYYHCTKRGLGPRCPEPAIRKEDLYMQVARFLATIAIEPRFEAWVLAVLDEDRQLDCEAEEARLRSLVSAETEVSAQLEELTGLRLRRLVSDEEFLARRSSLEAERIRLSKSRAASADPSVRFEPVRDAISMRIQAVDWFFHGEDEQRRLVLETTGSNPRLKGKMLSIEAAKPFAQVLDLEEFPRLCGDVQDVRTCPPQARAVVRKFIRDTQAALAEPESEHIAHNLKLLREHFQDRDRGFAEAA